MFYRTPLAVAASLLALICALLLPPKTTFAAGRAGFIPQEVLVWLDDASDLEALAADFRLNPTPIAQVGGRPIYRLQIASAVPPPALVHRLLQDDRIIYAEPNYLTATPENGGRSAWSTTSSQGVYQGQWAFSTMRFESAQSLTYGAGITVAVLDTGVDAQHPALGGRLSRGYDFVDDDTDPSEVGGEAYGHGTHVAGLVALAAPEASLMPVRVLDQNGQGNMWVLVEALLYAADPDGDPATDDGADVINLSLSTLNNSKLLADTVQKITCAKTLLTNTCRVNAGRGIVVVAAAGNSSSTIHEFPAALPVPAMLAVGATTASDTITSFSNYGPWVDINAPGENIWSSLPGGGYGAWNGTSMATPLVAGEAALVMAAMPKLRASDVVGQVVSSGMPLDRPTLKRADAATALQRRTVR